LWGFDTRQSIRVGVGMISRRDVGLLVAGDGVTDGLHGRDVFSAAVLVVLATTMATPPLLRMVFTVREAAHGLIEETIAGPPHEPQT
jgi:Kef-type K+ transport system membrane component KefB